ncbi:MAG: hypothetical protein FJ215_02540 [Ignavibacteria bacterium]|nr:hypothetical protein [Ignavibacteria bacterium]
MARLSLRAQVIITVAILALGVISAVVYITSAGDVTRENIVRLNRDRLATLTENLARRYGSVLTFIAPSQFEDTSLAERDEMQTLLVTITREELANATDVQAGFYHSIWKKYLAAGLPSDTTASMELYNRYLPVLVRATVEEQREQWSQHESGNSHVVIVTKPVYTRGRLVGVAWAFDSLEDQLSGPTPFNVIPFLQIMAVLGILLASYFVINLRNEIDSIRKGLELMKQDLTQRPRPAPGELRDITDSISELAETILVQQKDRETLQRTVQQKEKLASLGKVVAGVAHEIRTPLSAIKTRVQLWQRSRNKKQALSQESMELVVSELDRMEKSVQKLLYFSKQRKLNLQRTDLHELIESTLRTLKERLQRRRIRVTRQFAGGGLWADVDRLELREVIINLLTNAIDALPRGGEICIHTSADAEKGTVTIGVEDSGKGIASDVAERMFDPFFTTKETGTVLGLSTAYEIARAHDGFIEHIVSQEKGARFDVVLPQNGHAKSGRG